MVEQEIQPKQKQEVSREQEQTRPGRVYVPDVDIYETADSIYLRADMPGVEESAVDVDLHDDVLTIRGRVSPLDYDGLAPLYTEYNVGDFARRFTLPDGDRLDQAGITASLVDGVLEVRIPKTERAKPRRIEVRTGR